MSLHLVRVLPRFNRYGASGALSQRLLWHRLNLWLGAIRDAYVSLLPMTIVGALALGLAELPPLVALLRHLELPASDLVRAAQLFFNATFGIMGLLGAMAIAARTTRLLQQEDGVNRHSIVTVSAVAAVAFLVCVLPLEGPEFQVLGYASVFQSIVIGVLVAESMHAMAYHAEAWSERNLLEAGASLGYALQMVAYALLLFVVVGLLRVAVAAGLSQVATGFQGLAPVWARQGGLSAWWLDPVFVLVNQLLWTVGINGGQWLLYLAGQGSELVANSTLWHASHQASLMFLNTYAHLGGAGATWGLIVCSLLRARDPALRRLAWYSVLPAVLNVNELLLFGLPLILSRTLFLPFVLAPLAACLVAELAVHLRFLPLEGAALTWSTPALLSGYLSSGGWQGVAVQAVGIGLSALVYAPFLRRFEDRRAARLAAHFHEALDTLQGVTQTAVQPRVLARADAVGAVARSLHGDFEADLGGPRVHLAYQPQHDREGRLVGAEALLRWTHAVHGPISPAVIIKIAEESSLILAIGRWTLNQAARDMRAWRDLGHEGFHVGVNMSPLQLEDPAWSRQVGEVLQAHGLAAHDLELEVTEGQALASTAQTDRSLAELNARGLLLSMDDFGMGSTSLLYMHRFKLHTIKLDASLTREVCRNAVDRDIISCVCRLGHSQGVEVVAEYVETPEQRQVLLALGCDRFQGWLFSPALPADEFLAYLELQRSAM